MKKPTPQFLLIDIGNTRLKWATASIRGPIRPGGNIAPGKVTKAWIIALARKYSKHHLVLASVVPKLVPLFHRAFVGRIAVVNGNSAVLGLSFHYPKPAEIGADRLAAAVAAHARKQFPAIIVACGTATAFSILDAKGRFCGGVIAPGLQAQLDAILGATAQLPATTLRPPRRALAKSSEEAIRAGVMLNFQGGVKEILRQLMKEMPNHPKPHIFLTGGNAQYLTKALEVPFTLRPLLVFEGLLIIGLRLFP